MRSIFRLMKTLTLITVGFCLLVMSAFVARGDRLSRISDATGVSVETLEAQRATTGLGFGELETANLLANASGQNFDTIVARHQAGEGWGKIAQDYGFKLGDVVSAAHRSDQATLHARTGQGKSNSDVVRQHGRSDREFGRSHGRNDGRVPEKLNRGKGKSHK
jgi:hypothetical protein